MALFVGVLAAPVKAEDPDIVCHYAGCLERVTKALQEAYEIGWHSFVVDVKVRLEVEGAVGQCYALWHERGLNTLAPVFVTFVHLPCGRVMVLLGPWRPVNRPCEATELAVL